MIEKAVLPYAVTLLTQDGKRTLLNDNLNFEFASYALIDEEMNYNLVNGDQTITKGFGRVDALQPDIITDATNIIVFEPTYRTDSLNNFLFGDIVGHQLLPENIHNEFDVIRDMMDAPIVRAAEVKATQAAKKIEFAFSVVSGNLQDFYLNDAELSKWSMAVDVRGKMHVYQDNDTFLVYEDGTIYKGEQQYQSSDSFRPFARIFYTLQFSGDNVNKSFTFEKTVQPNEQLIIGTERLTADLDLKYALFGTFTIWKTFVFEDKSYKSTPITFSVKQAPYTEQPAIVLDGRSQVLDLYTSPYERHNIFTNVQLEQNKIEAKVYNNSLTDIVLLQNKLNGYLKLNPAFRFDIIGTKVNALDIEVNNVKTGRSLKLLTIRGDAVNATGGLLTIQEFTSSFVLYQHLFDDGYHMMMNVNIPETFGYLKLDDTTDDGKVVTLQYSLFGSKRNKLYISYTRDTYLGTQSYVETLTEFERLHHFTSPNQNIVFNFKQFAPLLMSDFEQLIIDID